MNGRPFGPGGRGRASLVLEYKRNAYSMLNMTKVTKRLGKDMSAMMAIMGFGKWYGCWVICELLRGV